jgi:anti-sigma regulatory factor (Ser/Thr protein kinase)
VTASRTFPCRAAAVPAARRFVRDVLSEQSQQIAEAAELMACELATNSVRHAETGFELVIELHDEIRIEVRDSGRGRPQLLSPRLTDTRGRGLRIVEAMSSAWGVVSIDGGKAVWFTLMAQPSQDGR